MFANRDFRRLPAAQSRLQGNDRPGSAGDLHVRLCRHHGRGEPNAFERHRQPVEHRELLAMGGHLRAELCRYARSFLCVVGGIDRALIGQSRAAGSPVSDDNLDAGRSGGADWKLCGTHLRPCCFLARSISHPLRLFTFCLGQRTRPARTGACCATWREPVYAVPSPSFSSAGRPAACCGPA